MVQLVLSTGLDDAALLYAGAIVLGALSGMAVNFFVSRNFVFAAAGRTSLNQVTSFVLVSLSTLLLRLILAFALVALLSLPLFGIISRLPVTAPVERLAHLGAVGLVIIYSFLAHKHVSFAGGIGAFFASRTAVRP